jgi:ribosomal protein S21
MDRSGNAVVVLGDMMPLDRALSQLKKALAMNGSFREQQAHAFYLKPGERKRLKSKRARAKVAKAARRREIFEPRD